MEKRGNMKLTHCGAHFGSARRDLSCWQIRNDDEDEPQDDRLQRCAACGEVFDLDDHAEEDDDE